MAALASVRRLGWVDDDDLLGPLAGFASGRPILNWAGRRTGEVRAAPSFDDV